MGLSQFDDCAMAMLHPHSANYLLGGRIPEPMEYQFTKLAAAIDCPEMVSDERFCNNVQCVKNKRVLFEEMQ